MKYCSYCGEELEDNDVICPRCGCTVRGSESDGSADDELSVGCSVLGFFLPIVGLILCLLWKEKTPLKAKSAGMGALIGCLLGIVLTVVYIAVFL